MGCSFVLVSIEAQCQMSQRDPFGPIPTCLRSRIKFLPSSQGLYHQRKKCPDRISFHMADDQSVLVTAACPREQPQYVLNNRPQYCEVADLTCHRSLREPKRK